MVYSYTVILYQVKYSILIMKDMSTVHIVHPPYYYTEVSVISLIPLINQTVCIKHNCTYMYMHVTCMVHGLCQHNTITNIKYNNTVIIQ